jgi:hypothetical protein
VQACQIDMADDCEISPKDAHELANRQAGGLGNLSRQAGGGVQDIHGNNVIENPKIDAT